MAILGIDEVGRGPLAGPLVIGAVILPEEKPEWVAELRDSKKLSEKKRENLSAIILEEAPATGLGWVTSKEVDELGMPDALRLATQRAVKSVQELHVPFSQIVIDGIDNFLDLTPLGKYVSTMPKADDLIKEVSAASIIAKVARDRYMVELAEKYPEYGFERHKGYGTEFHRRAIFDHGICPEHRRSFEPIKSLVGFSRGEKGVKVKRTVVKNTTKIGKKAETKVAEYLERLGHEIIARNYRTKRYEIDIVSVFENEIYFTEVKYRKTADYGGGFRAITSEKQHRMVFAATSFLESHQKYNRNYYPVLAAAEVIGEDFEVRDLLRLN